MTESQLQAAIIELAELLGWRVFHASKLKGNLPTYTGEGFVDLVMARDKAMPAGHTQVRMLYVECKSDAGKLRSAQRVWRSILMGVQAANDSVEYHLWRPCHWLDGTIERALK